MVNFPTQIPDCNSHNPALLYLFLSDANIFFYNGFPSIVYFPHLVVVSVSIDFPWNSQQDALFHRKTILVLIGAVFMILWEIPLECVFKLIASTATNEFCELVQVGIVVYIPHRKYQVKPHSSLWFLAACTAAISS